MNKLKVLVLFGLCVVFCHVANAEVQKLDTFNPDHCRQQLLSATDDYPVVLVYRSDESDQESVVETFEKLSEEYAILHPTRNFFKFDMSQNSFNWEAYTACTQQNGRIGTPSAMLYFKFQDPLSENVYMFGPIRLEAGDLSREEFIRLIELTQNKKANISKMFASQINHSKKK